VEQINYVWVGEIPIVTNQNNSRINHSLGY